MKVFVIFDSAAEAYGPPMFKRATGEAIRQFQDWSNDPKSMIHQHPDQFTLFESGSYDELTGIIQMLPAHKSLGTALEYKNKGV